MLSVKIGGVDESNVADGMSGGWEEGFTVAETDEAALSFRYKLSQNDAYESDEYSELRVALDGVAVESGGNPYVARLVGDGDGGDPTTTGWQAAALTLGELAPGTHTLTIGAYNNQKTQLNETTELLVDDVAVTGTVAGGGGGGGSTTVWLHKDHLGSIQAATDGDGAAALRRGYAPYGAQLWATAATFTEAKNFIGERLDVETGLLYLHARYYDPVMGQFLSADPSHPLQPGVGVNRYAYAGGNPVAYADPYGLGYADRVADESVANATGPNGAPKKDWSRAGVAREKQLRTIAAALATMRGSFVSGSSAAATLTGFSFSDVLDFPMGFVRSTADMVMTPGHYFGVTVPNALNGFLNFCGALCDEGFHASIGDLPGLAILGPVRAYANLPRFSKLLSAEIVAAFNRIAHAVPPGKVPVGTKVYRAYGEYNVPLGHSWTTVDPRTVSDYRNAAGLPSVNTGRFAIEGTITNNVGVKTRSALPLDGNVGGLPEVVVPNPVTQIQVNRVSGVNPPF